MPRITNNYIAERVEKIKTSNLFPKGIEMEVNFQGLPSRPRIENKDGGREISPRLSAPEMDIWLDGFVACLTELERMK